MRNWNVSRRQLLGGLWALPWAVQADVPSIPSDPLPNYGLGLRHQGAALALQGHALWVAGGHLLPDDGENLPSHRLEEVDLRTGQVRQRPALPMPLLQAQARWLDEDRLLLKGVVSAQVDDEDPDRSLASAQPRPGGLLALYSQRAQGWRVLDDSLALQSAELMDVASGQAWLLAPDGQVWQFDTQRLKLRVHSRLIRARPFGTLRVWPEGRLVVAGGKVAQELISVLDPRCTASDCPDRYTGYGSLRPSRRHELFDPAHQGWRLSAPSRAAGLSAVVLADGSVVKLGQLVPNVTNSRWLIERSSPDGQRWAVLPRPDEANAVVLSRGNEDDVNFEPAQCRLVLARDPADPQRELLLLQQGEGLGRVPIASQMTVWIWDGARQQWHLLQHGQDAWVLNQPQALPAALGWPGFWLVGAALANGAVLWRK